MHRRLNRRWFFALLVGIPLFGAGAHFLHAFQVKRTAGFLLVQVDKAEQAKNLPKALNYLARYLALRPNAHEVRSKYALVLANEKLITGPRSLSRAYQVLQQAL